MKMQNRQRRQALTLILLTSVLCQGNLISIAHSSSSQSECPSISVDCPDDMEKSVVVFKAKISGGRFNHQALTYKWVVSGGEIKEGARHISCNDH